MLVFCQVRAVLNNFHVFYLYLVGSLAVALRLLSCVFVMLFPLGAKALPQTHSAEEVCGERKLMDRPLKK